MKKPDIPRNENKRLETLRSLKLLDTEPEERFDRLTRLAKSLFDVPIALVTLVDENRQWFKSKQGLDVEETNREVSFCGHAIHDDDIFLIPDTLKDERFSDNPLVLDEPHIRFYAGCPLKTMNGYTLGTLCIIDKKPRNFTEKEFSLLRDLASTVEQEIAAVQLSTLDELTMISNRRGFITLAQQALELCKRNKSNLTLLIFDLDGFKEINDCFGHAEGNKALIAFADAMHQVFRDADVFGRIGGDEFAALLSNLDESESHKVLSRFSQAIDNFNEGLNKDYQLEYSVGQMNRSCSEDLTIEELLDCADKKMYIDKKSKQ